MHFHYKSSKGKYIAVKGKISPDGQKLDQQETAYHPSTDVGRLAISTWLGNNVRVGGLSRVRFDLRTSGSDVL